MCRVAFCIAMAIVCSPTTAISQPPHDVGEAPWAIAPELLASGLAPDAFAQALRTGEYSIALQLADAQPDRTLRQQWVESVAAAQAAKDERNAMVHTLAQQPPGDPFGQTGNRANNGNTIGGGQNGLGQGGNTQADFDSLIELITDTIEPLTWNELGGNGDVAGFPGGVYVDSSRTLRRIRPASRKRFERSFERSREHRESDTRTRKVSLPRLERAAALQIARKSRIGPDLAFVGGLRRIESVTVYADTGDVVIAGPASDAFEEGIRLSDLAVVFRAVLVDQVQFGCSIDPSQANLTRAQTFLQKSSLSPLRPGKRVQWLEDLRSAVGKQTIRLFGIAPQTTTAFSLVAADHHMKLVGMGLVPAPDGVESYLDSLDVGENGQVAPIDLLRWWFTMHYDSALRTEDRLAFRWSGPGVRILGENEWLLANGQRQATGQSTALNDRFADSFSDHFEQLADAYPVYRQLQSIFDLAMTAAVMRDHRLGQAAGWQPDLLLSMHPAIVRTVIVPTQVDSVINHRVTGGTQIIAGVSGGVMVNPASRRCRVANASQTVALRRRHSAAQPDSPRGAKERWWWD